MHKNLKTLQECCQIKGIHQAQKCNIETPKVKRIV